MCKKNMLYLLLLLLLLSFSFYIGGVHCRNSDDYFMIDGEKISLNNRDDPGKALYLTPYIEKGKIVEARQAALVKPFVHDVVSYSGYLTIDKRYNSNMFFWYFRSEETFYKDAPTVVWLQGGPGSSMYLGLFNENGPYIINQKTILKRNTTWSKISNLIYFDNPVGTGYSFTDSDLGYAKNESKVGVDLYEALLQIMELFPYMKKNGLYVAGESYAGKYVPALGHTIIEKNRNNPKTFIHLYGLLIGDGFSDPIHMLNYGDYLYQLGLIDANTRRKFKKIERKAVKLIKNHQWHRVSQLFDKAMGENVNSLFYKNTGFGGFYNYYDPSAGDWMEYETKFIGSAYFRKHVHVGNNTLNDGLEVYQHLYDDIPKSVIHWIEKIVLSYPILFYNGQLDVICAYPLTENVLKHMKWPLSHRYEEVHRHIYHVDNNVAGYYKTVGHLTEMLIRDAGHMVPANQPVWAFQMFKDFINNRFKDDDHKVYKPFFKRKFNFNSV